MQIYDSIPNSLGKYNVSFCIPLPLHFLTSLLASVTKHVEFDSNVFQKKSILQEY